MWDKGLSAKSLSPVFTHNISASNVAVLFVALGAVPEDCIILADTQT